MKLAVIETGGKQYLISEGSKIQVEKLKGDAGSQIIFDKVLLIVDNTTLGIGKPYYNTKVTAEIVAQKRLPKVTTFKYHSKTRYRKKRGHRQHVTIVKILEIK